MSARRKQLVGALVLGLVFVAARGPLHAVTFALPVSNDDAILLLMARHVLHGELATTLWNQPYNGALDAYLLAPLVALLGHHHGFRVYETACALLLVGLTGLLAARLAGRAAGWWAALLAACGTPYMALMTATGPPPNFLMPLVTGLPLLVALRPADAPRSRPAIVFALGVLAGLAVWNSSLAIPAFVGMAAGLAAAGWRCPVRAALPGLAGFAVGLVPLAWSRWSGAAGASTVTAASAVTAIRPRWLWAGGLSDLGHALLALFGFRVPLVVDGPEKAALPLWLVSALAIGFGLALLAGGATERRALALLGWAGALAGAFALSRRTGADELRYLYGLNPPVLALAGIGLAWLSTRSRALAIGVGAAILVPWVVGDRVLAAVWRDPAHAVRVWQVPDIRPAIGALRRSGTRSAYASLQFAGRLGLEAGGDVVASQAWNERIPGDPLRFRDEVDLDPAPAWVLSPTLSRGMPRAPRFRDLVGELGGRAEEEVAGDLVVFRSFVGPYDESQSVPATELHATDLGGASLGPVVFDRDPATVWRSPAGLGRGSGLVVRSDRPRRWSALVLAVDLVESPLAVPWVAESGGTVIARGPARHGMQWLNGAPRAGRQALLAISLGGVVTGEVRVIFQGPGPRLAVSEVFVYGPDEPARARSGAGAEGRGLDAARAGRWPEAHGAFLEALRLDPDRASLHAAVARSAWRETRRQRLDVESIDDGGPDLVLPR